MSGSRQKSLENRAMAMDALAKRGLDPVFRHDDGNTVYHLHGDRRGAVLIFEFADSHEDFERLAELAEFATRRFA